jgi:hypothetical protein
MVKDAKSAHTVFVGGIREFAQVLWPKDSLEKAKR